MADFSTVLEASRRHITILTKEGDTKSGIISSKALDITTGDNVQYEVRDGRIFVTAVELAKRSLFRSYQGAIKRMGANIDQLFIIAACSDTFSTSFVDRVFIAARSAGIPAVLIINKIDLGIEHIDKKVSVYKEIGIPVVECSAKLDIGIEEIRGLVELKSNCITALCGVSGVGKSTILNKLLPSANARTGSVSNKRGQGRQTTSQPRGFVYSTKLGERRIIIDFPGVQFFGLTHLSLEKILKGFDDFTSFAGNCRFGNCKHISEPDCGVRAGVDNELIARWRYESYCQIVEELESNKEY